MMVPKLGTSEMRLTSARGTDLFIDRQLADVLLRIIDGVLIPRKTRTKRRHLVPLLSAQIELLLASCET